MVNLVDQYERYSEEIDNRIRNVLTSGNYIGGDFVRKFESELSLYLKSKYTITCGNGTDALFASLMALNLKKGDEVLVPSFTFVSTVEVICLLELKPVFLDIDPNTFLLNSDLIEKYISSRTKVIMPVHLFGQCCDMQFIQGLAKKYGLFVIEDAAQSIGASYSFPPSFKQIPSGTMGHLGITSFYPSKNLGAFGDGGAIFTQNKQLADKVRLLVNHGQNKKYHYEMVGFNSRLDGIQASILSFKLTLLKSFNKKRIKIADFYDENLKFVDWIQIPVRARNTTHVFHQYSILLSSKVNREDFQNYLLKHSIPTMIYYPIPIHKQKPYKSFNKISLPVSEMVAKRIISLPICPEIDLEQVQFICEKIKNFLR